MRGSLCIIICILFLLPFSAAVHIAPTEIPILITEQDEQNISILVINPYATEVHVQGIVRGPLQQYIEIEALLIPAETTLSLPIRLDFPTDIQPGEHTHTISFMYAFTDPRAPFMRTAQEVTLSLFKQASPEHVQVDIDIESVLPGQETVLRVAFHTVSQTVKEGDVHIEIRDEQQVLQERILLTEYFVFPHETNVLSIPIETNNMPPGRYTAYATFTHTTQTATEQTTFIVGAQELRVQRFENEVYAGKEQQRLEITVENMWNEPITITHAEIQIGTTITALHTTEIRPFSQQTLSGYIRTENLIPGLYVASVHIHAQDTAPLYEVFPLFVREEQTILSAPRTVLGTTDILFFLILLTLISTAFMHAIRKL